MKRIFTTLAVCVAVGVFGGVIFARTTRPGDVMHALVRAQPERVSAARFSMETEYHECTVDPAFADSLVQREECGEPNEPPRALARLADSTESLHPDTLRASLLAAVIWPDGDEGSLQAAIDRLLEAREFTSDQVPLLVALSAASLVHAERTQDPQYVGWALEHALEALEHEPRNVLALFNAALATQALPLTEEAEARWAAYLAVDSTSPWAEEARSRRNELRTATAMLPKPTASSTPEEVVAFAKAHPQQARELGWDSVLGRWGRAVQEGKVARADSMLAFAERLGKALESRRGDTSLTDAVTAIRLVHGDPARTTKLARLHRAYAAGRDRFEAGAFPQARDSFRVVIHQSPPSPTLLNWARTSLAATRDSNISDEERLVLLLPVIADPDSIRHPALLARAHWVLATTLLGTSRDSARKHFRRASETYNRLGEWEYYGAVRNREAWAAHEEGNTLGAYRMVIEAQRVLSPHRASSHLHNTLLQSAVLARRDGMRRAALLLQEEDSKVAIRARNPALPVEALLGRARILALSDSSKQALRVLDSVRPLIETMPDRVQAKFHSNAMLYSSALLVTRGDAKYMAKLDSAISYFSQEGKPAWLSTILMLRAEFKLERGDLRGAYADLGRIRREIPGVPDRGAEAHLRAAVIERLRGLYDKLVMGFLRAGQPLHALQALEQGRLSFAQDSGRQERTGGWTALTPGQVVLEYALIGDTLLTWVVRRDSITVREQRLDRDELLRTIARVNVALESPGRTVNADTALRQLYDVLIRPVADRIPGGSEGETELVIVADGEVAGVPFPALMNARNRRYLVQDHPIRFAAALADASQARLYAPVDGPALLVANPAFDRYANAELDLLPGASAEVDSLRTVYGDAKLLARDSATVAAFREQAGGARVIHFAGHAVFDDRRPERSYLLLADSGTAGRLRADSVNSMNLEGVRLVVLSACSTLRGRQGRSGGFAGLSGAMLSAGADGVVGSLWRVNDVSVQPLMLHFHRAYGEDPDPARALRNAQLKMIDSGNRDLRSPTAWAGFRYMGR